LVPKGGIAQLVERQLCKLEVRGSNPLASSPESFRGCRAEALAKADLLDLADANDASYDSASQQPSMAGFFYIYILQSEQDKDRFYTGLTGDLPKRLRNHNAGRILHTAKCVRAARFEKYLKSASGRAFVKKHF
jgi:putative endonuclease